jgi:hypothetical protein
VIQKESWHKTYYRYVLGILNSILLTYYVFKKKAEIDAAQAFSNFRIEDFKAIPIPIKPMDQIWMKIYQEIIDMVQEMLDSKGELIGSPTDAKINLNVLKMYNLTLAEYRYVLSQLGFAEYQKAMGLLFPDGSPAKPTKRKAIVENLT